MWCSDILKTVKSTVKGRALFQYLTCSEFQSLALVCVSASKCLSDYLHGLHWDCSDALSYSYVNKKI